MVYWVGKNVTASFDRNSGSVELSADGGTLFPDWTERAGIEPKKIQSIKVAQGTVKLPKNATKIFGDLRQLKSIDLKGFDSSETTNMGGMFFGDSLISLINLKYLDTSRVEDMQNMFAYCYSLKNIDLSVLDTSSVTNIKEMFYQCHTIRSINMTGFNTSRVMNLTPCNVKFPSASYLK